MTDEKSAQFLYEVIHCLCATESLSLTRLLLMLKRLSLESARAEGDSGFIEAATAGYAEALQLHRMAASTLDNGLLRLQETKLMLEGKYSTEMTEQDLVNSFDPSHYKWYLGLKADVESLLAKV
jgi:hypothetical protein